MPALHHQTGGAMNDKERMELEAKAQLIGAIVFVVMLAACIAWWVLT